MTHRYRSADGLTTSSDPSFVALWDKIVAEHAENGVTWTTKLRAMGVKLAHPDDGWVKRDAPEPYLSLSWYPLFNDDPQVGDLIALGYHYMRHWMGNFNYRLARVTRIEDRWSLIHYYYEDTGIRLPPEPSRRTWWRRLFRRGG